MAQTNASVFKTGNRIAVENREVFNRESNFVTDLADSAYNTLVITIDQVNDQALLTGTGVLPANSIVQEITAVCTTAFTTDNGIYGVNIGTGSLDADGGSKASMFNSAAANNIVLHGSAVTEIPQGRGFSTHGHISANLGSTKTGSFAITAGGALGRTFFTEDTTLTAQLSSSGAAILQNGTGGVLKVAIRYDKLV